MSHSVARSSRGLKLTGELSSMEHISDLDQQFLWRGGGGGVIGAFQRKKARI